MSVWEALIYGLVQGVTEYLPISSSAHLILLPRFMETQDLGQIALAKFENPEALFKIGKNSLKEARDSGPPAVGTPGKAGRGKIFAKSLERSTVDMASAFVNLIQNQRAFQANAKTITTTDELLNEVINLKR